MKYKTGDKVHIRQDSQHYTQKYAGTFATVDQADGKNYCTVIGYDGHKFMCPYSYLEDDDFFTYSPPATPSSSQCECGAHAAYGEDCPPFFHYDYCKLYRPKE